MIRLRTLGALDLTHANGVDLRAVLSQPRRMALLVCAANSESRGELTLAAVFARAMGNESSRPHGMMSEARRFEIAHALYLARDWAAADTAFRALAAADTANVIYSGSSERSPRAETTRRGPASSSRDSTLYAPRSPNHAPSPATGRRKISSILGDEQHALLLMAEVWPQGDVGPHMDFNHGRIGNAEGFRRLFRPKG